MFLPKMMRRSLFSFTVVAIVSLFLLGGTAGATPTNENDITSLESTPQNTANVGQFLNVTTVSIDIGGTTYLFTDRDPFDSTHEYLIQGSQADGRISFSRHPGLQPNTTGRDLGTLDVDFIPPNGSRSDTSPNSFSVAIENTFSTVWAEYTAIDTIQFLGGGGTYTPTGDSNSAGELWIRSGSGTCRNLLIVEPGGANYKLYRMESNRENGTDGIDNVPQPERDLLSTNFPPSCEILSTVPDPGDDSADKTGNTRNARSFQLGNAALVNPANTASAPSSSSITGAGVAAVDDADSCNSQGGEFSFLLCPLLEALNAGVGRLDTEIRESLEVDSDFFRTSDLQGGTEGADRVRAIWSRIRDISYILLIPVLLIMVIGTALGFQFIDAYTVKRAMPRLLVAVVFMALSFDIGVFMIEVFNNIGAGIAGIVAAPFGGAENLELTDIFEAGAGNDSLAFFVGGPLASLAAISFLSIGIIGSYMLVAFISLLVIFALLAVRELLIIALLIISPLAILAWIFPGNDAPWKLWWGTFSKLLYIYPLVVGMLMLGRGLAALINEAAGSGNGGGDPFNSAFIIFVKLVAYIGPFFFILAVFKYAGGVFANLAGMVNDQEKGIFDRQRKFRADKRGQIRSDIKAGNRFRGAKDGSLRGRANNRLQNIAMRQEAAKRGGLTAGLRYGNLNAAKNDHLQEERKHMSEDIGLQTRLKNDDFAHILTLETEAQMTDYLENKGYSSDAAATEAAAAMAAVNKYGRHATAVASVDAKAASKTSYTGGISELLADIERASGGDESLAMAMLGSSTAVAAAAGRLDLGGGSYGEKAAMLKSKLNRPDRSHPIKYIDDDGVERIIDHKLTDEEINARQSAKALDSMTGYQLAQLHPTAARNMVESVGYDLENMAYSIDTDQANLNSLLDVKAEDRTEQQKASIEVLQNSLATKRVALGQKAGHLKTLKAQAASQAPPEVARAFADGLMTKGKFSIGQGGGKQTFANTDAFIEYVTGAASEMDPFPKTPEAEQLIEGYRSVSGGRIPPEQIAQYQDRMNQDGEP